jgi:calcineurin-like phosphoesterase family protein
MDPSWPTADEQIAILKKYVGKHDTLIHLGDVGDVSYISKLKCYKVLITGNHDAGVANYKRVKRDRETVIEQEWDPLYIRTGPNSFEGRRITKERVVKEAYDNHLFDEVYDGPLFIGQKILLSHEPIPGLNFCVNIHGHVHSGAYIGDNYVTACSNCVNHKPINLGELLKTGIMKKVDSIHRQTIDRATENRMEKPRR